MTRLEDELRKFKEEYEGVSRKAAEYIEKSPEGYLRISECNSRKQYYQVNSDNSGKYYNGKYLRKDEIQIAKALAQKEYAKNLLKIADERVKQVNNFLMSYEENELGKVYSNLSVQRKELITPIVLDDEEYARRWMAVEYRRKPEKIYYNEYGQKKPETEYYSKRNEKVRSKSEKLIADLLIDMGVYYRYEYPIQLKGYYDGVAYVDFYLLKVKERKEICYEHCGMSDDRGYYNDFVFRSNCYTKNGYIQGENLLYSFESSEYPVNLKAIEKQVKSILGM